MNIESFRDIHTITHGRVPMDSKYKEFDYCLPLCNPDGLFIELGVWFARSINYMAKSNPQYHFYGFDTFEGVDEIWDTGGKTVDMSKFTVAEVDIDSSTGLPIVENNITLIKGLFQDTLSDWKKDHPENISFINMDPDIYSATIYALNELNDQIVPGTIIRFDELSCWRTVEFPGFNENEHAQIAPYTTWEKGEWRALNEWLSNKNRKVEPLWRNWHQSAGVRVIN